MRLEKFEREKRQQRGEVTDGHEQPEVGKVGRLAGLSGANAQEGGETCAELGAEDARADAADAVPEGGGDLIGSVVEGPELVGDRAVALEDELVGGVARCP